MWDGLIRDDVRSQRRCWWGSCY